jgi:hypothetical protein
MNDPKLIHIITMADSLKPDQMPLVQSLFKYREHVKLVVITNKKNVGNWVKIPNVVIVEYRFSSLSKTASTLRKVLRNAQTLNNFMCWFSNNFLNEKMLRFSIMPLVNSRYFLAAKYLESLPVDQSVIFCDGRDLIFQRSPREIFKEFFDSEKSSVQLCNENYLNVKSGLTHRINTSPLNLKWISSIGSSFILEETVINNSVINGGFLMGQSRQLLDVLEGVSRIMEKSKELYISQLDQSALNIYQWGNTASITNVRENGVLVFNMCSLIPGKLLELSDGKLYLDGILIPIVHMFDRYGHYDSGVLRISIAAFKKHMM